MADVNPEKEEQAEQAEEHREAFERAVKAGKAGKEVQVVTAAAPGWAGEQLVDTVADDWEPAIAADPAAPFVYLLDHALRHHQAVPRQLPDPWIALEISSDGGATWTRRRPLCACKGWRPVRPDHRGRAGHGASVYAHVHERLQRDVHEVDQSRLDVDRAGQGLRQRRPGMTSRCSRSATTAGDVYIPFNGPTGGDPWLAQSHDFGVTWSQVKLVNSNRYYFAFDADVAADGTVYLAAELDPVRRRRQQGHDPNGAIDEHVFVSTQQRRDLRGPSRRRRSSPGIACTPAGCPPDFYLGHIALTVDGDGPRRLPVRRRDECRRPPDDHRASGRPNAGAVLDPGRSSSRRPARRGDAPAIESRGSGDVRAWYAQTTAAATSMPGTPTTGARPTAASPGRRRSNISDATSGAAYKSAAGYLEVYGDYGEIAITSAGKTIAVWGEGTSYIGPGGVWFNRQP